MDAAVATLLDPNSSREQRQHAQHFIDSQLDHTSCLNIVASGRSDVLLSIAFSRLQRLLVASLHDANGAAFQQQVQAVISGIPQNPQIVHLRAIIFKLTRANFGSFLSSADLTVALLDQVDPFTCGALGAPLQYHLQMYLHFTGQLLPLLIEHLLQPGLDAHFFVRVVARLIDWPHGDHLANQLAFRQHNGKSRQKKGVMPLLQPLFPLLVKTSATHPDPLLRASCRTSLAVSVTSGGDAGFHAALGALGAVQDLHPSEFYSLLLMILALLKCDVSRMTPHLNTIGAFACSCVLVEDCRALAVEVASLLPPAHSFPVFAKLVTCVAERTDIPIIAAMELQSDFAELVEDACARIARQCAAPAIQSFLGSLGSFGPQPWLIAFCGCFLTDAASGENIEIPVQLRDAHVASGVVLLLHHLHTMLMNQPNDRALLWLFERCAPTYLFNAPNGPYDDEFGRTPRGIRFLDSLVGACIHSDRLLCNLVTNQRIVGHVCRSKSWPAVLSQCAARWPTLPTKSRKVALRALVASANGLKSDMERRQFLTRLMVAPEPIVEVISALGAASSKSRAVIRELIVAMFPQIVRVVNGAAPSALRKCCKGSAVILSSLREAELAQCASALFRVALEHNQLDAALLMCRLMADHSIDPSQLLCEVLTRCTEQAFASEQQLRVLLLSALASCAARALPQTPAIVAVLQWALQYSTDDAELQWTLECAKCVPQLQPAVMHSMASNPLWTRSQCQSASATASWVSSRLEHIKY